MKKHLLRIVVPVLVVVVAVLLCFVPGCKKIPPSARASPPILIGDGSMFFESEQVRFECKGNEFRPITQPGQKPYKMEWVEPNNGSGKRTCKGDCAVRADWQNGFFIEFKSNPAGMGIRIDTNPDCDDGKWVAIPDPPKVVRWEHELIPPPEPPKATITFQSSPHAKKEEICKRENCRAKIN